MIRFKNYFLLLVFALIFSSCFTGFFDETEEKIDGIKRAHSTKVCFENSGANNIHKVSVFYDNDRTSKIGNDILPGQISDSYDIFPSHLYTFYLTFYLSISGVEIPIAPSAADGGMLQEPIKRDEENTVKITSLFTSVSDIDKILVNDCYYITIKNATGPAFAFLSGNQLYNVVGGEEGDEYITVGKTAIYKLTATTPSNPRIQVSGNPYTLPVTTFERGKVYSFTYNGGSSIVFDGSKDISLNSTLAP